ncbi:MAG: hypothetical protein AAF035_02260 [Pseudomonadota bacterium]
MNGLIAKANKRAWAALLAGAAFTVLATSQAMSSGSREPIQRVQATPQQETPSAPSLRQAPGAAPLTPMRPNQRLSNANGIIRLFDSVLLYPLPDWTPLNTSTAMQASRFKRGQQPGVFSLQAIPREETYQDWKNLYALLAIQNFRGGPARNMMLAESNFQQGCAPGTVRMERGTAREGVPTLLVACGAYAKQPDMGEVGVFVFLQRGNTAVRLYREWRGPAFDPDDTAAWPVERPQLMKVFNQLQAARLRGQ